MTADGTVKYGSAALQMRAHIDGGPTLNIRHVNKERKYFFSRRRRHTRWTGDWSSDVCSSDLLFFWAWVQFQELVEEVTGYPVPMFQRVDQAGFELPLDERVLADADTLFLFGLDHVVTGQEAKIGRASCRGRGEDALMGGTVVC